MRRLWPMYSCCN